MTSKEHDVSPVESPRQSLTAEENLPLYEEFHHTDEECNTPPSKKASPDEVRDFITRLLIHNRGLPQDHVRRAAAKWTTGSGQELHSYTPSMYLDIFGREDGWIIYREVKLCIYREQSKSSAYRHGACMSLTGVLSFLALRRLTRVADIAFAIMALLETIFVSVAYWVTNDAVQLVAIITSVFGGIICFGTAIASCIKAGEDHESYVEKELQAAMRTTQQV